MSRKGISLQHIQDRAKFNKARIAAQQYIELAEIIDSNLQDAISANKRFLMIFLSKKYPWDVINRVLKQYGDYNPNYFVAEQDYITFQW